VTKNLKHKEGVSSMRKGRERKLSEHPGAGTNSFSGQGGERRGKRFIPLEGKTRKGKTRKRGERG